MPKDFDIYLKTMHVRNVTKSFVYILIYTAIFVK
jgi:hypothetical protein